MSEAWDFTKLPDSEHGNVIAAYDTGNIRELISIHDRYQLSSHSYCCDHTGLLAWFKYGIENGSIGKRSGKEVAQLVD